MSDATDIEVRTEQPVAIPRNRELLPSDILRPVLMPWVQLRWMSANPTIVNLTYDGVDGIRRLLPRSEDERIALLRRLPHYSAFDRLSQRLGAALGAKAATRADLGKIVAAVIAGKPQQAGSGRRYLNTLLLALEIEGQIRPTSPYVVAAATWEAALKTPFLPDASEMVGGIEAMKRRFADGRDLADALTDVLLDVYWDLVDAGRIEGERREEPELPEGADDDDIPF